MYQPIPWLEDETILIALESRGCEEGEYYTNIHTCKKCNDKTNTYAPRTIKEIGEPCEECLENAVCVEAKTYPAEGFVRMNKNHLMFVQCFNENACLEGNDFDDLQNCAEGYTGIMCTSCDDFYWKSQGTF